jgi:hypothetical protein
MLIQQQREGKKGAKKQRNKTKKTRSDSSCFIKMLRNEKDKKLFELFHRGAANDASLSSEEMRSLNALFKSYILYY